LELFPSANWSLDRRQKSFDPSKGWSMNLDFRTNSLYHGIDSGFSQFSEDIKYYQPLFWENHKLAFRIRSLIRTHNGGELNRVLTGGDASVRGYLPSQIGLMSSWYGNNAIVFSGEYRFPIYYLPTLLLPNFARSSFSWVTGNDQYFSFRLDGALFADCGRVTESLSNFLTSNGTHRQTGLGVGFGLRLLEIQKCFRWNFEIVWPDYLASKKLDFSGARVCIYGGGF
jgi:outer membrane protein assembly factor BamA